MSIRMPRACTCGSANTWSSVLTGLQGTPERRQAVDPLAAVVLAPHDRPASARTARARCSTRRLLVAKRGSAASSARAGEARTISGTAQSLPTARMTKPSRARERLVGHDVGVLVAQAARHLAGEQVVGALVDQPGDLGVEQGDVDLLALAGGVAVPQGRQDRHGRVHAAHDVGDADADLHRRPSGSPVRLMIPPRPCAR